MDESSKNQPAEKKCKYCRKKVVDSVDCIKCGSSYHPSCATRVEIVILKGKYSCCENNVASGVRVQRKSSEKTENCLDMDETKLKNIIKDCFQQFIKPVEQKMGQKLDGVEAAVQFMSNSFDEQKSRFEAIIAEMKELKQENCALKQRVQLLETKLDYMEVKERENNIIVAGVPKQPNSNPKQTINKILGAMNVGIQQNDIVECFCLKKDDAGPMLVKFSNVQIKKDVLKTIKQLKGTTVHKCKLEGPDNKIYLNEDLPLNKRILFKKTREVQKKKGFKAAFCANGTIYLKKTEQNLSLK